MYIYLSHRFGTELSLSGFLVELYSTNITTALWYLYAYLAFLLMLPFLRRISRSAQEKDYLYLTSLMAFVGLLRTAELLLFDYKININSNFDLHIVSQIIYYPLIGDYLANKLPDSKLTKRNVVLITLIGVVGLIINCLLTVRWCTVLGKWEYSSFERHIARFVFLPTISVFVGVKYLFMHIRLSETANRAIAYIGSCTFGIYLFERIYRTQTIRVYTVLDRYLPRLVACLIWVFVAFVAGLAVTTVLKKIPLLKKLI